MKKKRKKERLWCPNGYIFAALRRIWRWSPSRRECLEKARASNGLYTCHSCAEQFDRKAVAIDHIVPVVSTEKGFEGWDIYVRRLYCDASNLQILCKPCHAKKSKEENKVRRKHK